MNQTQVNFMLYHIYKVEAEQRTNLGRMLGTLWDAESPLDSSVDLKPEPGKPFTIPLSLLVNPDSVNAHLQAVMGESSGGRKKEKTMSEMSKEEFLATIRGSLGAFQKPKSTQPPPPPRPVDDPFNDPEVRKAQSASALSPEQFKALLGGKLPEP